MELADKIYWILLTLIIAGIVTGIVLDVKDVPPTRPNLA